MSKGWQVVGAFIVVFLAGAAFGIVFTLRYAVDHLPLQQREAAPMRAPVEFNVQSLRGWVREGQLNLTASQRQQVVIIMDEAGEDIQRLQRENQHSAALILEHMQDRVEQVLNPTQRVKFEELRDMLRMRLQHYQQLMQKRRERLRELRNQQASD